MRSTSTPATWPSNTPVRLTYLEEVCCGAWARPGALVGQRHELERPLNAGGAAALWHARRLHGAFAQECTLQLLDPSIAEDPGLLEVFHQEARAAASIDHPHIARVLDFGVDHGSGTAVPFLVLEPLAGETLGARLSARGRLTARELLRIVRELALGLEALHGWSLVHGCLDPAHVFLAGGLPAGEAPVTKLLFAIDEVFADHLRLVRKLSHQLSGSLSPEGFAAQRRTGGWEAESAPHHAGLGTAEYQSPEQLLGHGPVNERSDLWSLAVVAFEALTGTPAFSGSSLGERLVQICSGESNSPPEGLELASGFAAWFQKGACKLPGDRFGSARHMAETLTNILDP